MSKKDPLYPHVPKVKPWLSTPAGRLGLIPTAEDLQLKAEKLQRDIYSIWPDAKKLNKRITDAVDALSDVGVGLRTISGGGRAL